MSKPITMKQVGKGMLMSISAQVVSLIISFILNLVVPKFIDEYQYAYWQTYLLYISYVGILHFGLLDGIVLRYSQYDYEELNKEIIRSQFLALLLMDSLFAICTVIISNLFFSGISFEICIYLSIGIVTRNLFTYTSYSFQITNRINKYAILILSQRLFYGVGIVSLLIFGIRNFAYFCLIDLFADIFGIIIGSFSNKGMYFGSLPRIGNIIDETKKNVITGIMLMIANWASHFMTGSAKMIVQWHWHSLTFGKVTFAFSVTNLFLTFVTAISVVLFPALKRINQDELPSIYDKLRALISPILFYALILYFPGSIFLRYWIPKYNESLIYLGLLLPLIVFSSKVSLLTNNYLKAYRKEKTMFIINIVCMLLGCFSYFVLAYCFDNLVLLLISLVLIVMLRSIISEIVVTKILNYNYRKEFLLEFAVTMAFIIVTYFSSLSVGLVSYIIVLLIYSLLIKDDFKLLFNELRKPYS